MKKENETLLELCAGIIMFATIAQLVGIWFSTNKLAYSIGIWFGAAIAVCLAINMAKSISRLLDSASEKQAGMSMRIAVLLRYFIVAVALLISAKVEWMSIIGVFLGVFGLKVAAYLQPITHKLTLKIKKGNSIENDKE